MILTAYAIQEALAQGALTIQPFTKDNLGTISYKFSLGDYIIVLDQMQDSKKPSKGKLYVIPARGMLLQPGILYLACYP